MKYILSLLAILLIVGCNSKTNENSTDTSNIIIDNMHVVSNDKKIMQEYKQFNEHLIRDFDIDFRTIITQNAKDIDIYANKEFAKLQAKSRSKSGKALLMVVNTKQDKVRLEVSMALEPIYTDAFVSYIERKGFVPYFRDNKITGAIYMAAELISDRAYEAQKGKEFMPPMQSKYIGAGAKTKANIGIKDKNAKKGNNVLADSSDTPENILNKYLKVLKNHNTNPNLDIYTKSTQKFFRKWTVTEINQNHEIEFIQKCKQGKQFYISPDGNHAVAMNNPIKQRSCSPYFFKKEDGKWKLDIATMAQILRFNSTMQFHFDIKKRLQGEAKYYAFAFDGYMLGKNGFPYEVPAKRKMDSKYRWGYTCTGWYYPQDKERVKQNPQKYTKCWVKYVWQGSPADINLGLKNGDAIIAIGDEMGYNQNASFNEFMSYMNNLPSGKIATVYVIPYKGKTIVKRQGIAP